MFDMSEVSDRVIQHWTLTRMFDMSEVSDRVEKHCTLTRMFDMSVQEDGYYTYIIEISSTFSSVCTVSETTPFESTIQNSHSNSHECKHANHIDQLALYIHE